MGKQITLLDDEQWPKFGFGFELPIQWQSTALGVIDVQHYCTDSKGHLAGVVRQHSAELFDAYEKRVQEMMGKIQKLLKAFRAAGCRVFFTRHGILLPDGADLVARRRQREDVASMAGPRGGKHMPLKGDPAHEIVPEVAPLPGELVLDKNTSSAFHSTPIDLLLRNMNVDTLVLTGLAGDMCVLTTALDAADRGFHVIIAADACASLDPGTAEAAQVLFQRTFGYVKKTDEILDWLGPRSISKLSPIQKGS